MHGGPVVMVIDNAPCHSQMKTVFLTPEFEGCKLLRLALYSPMVNPTKNIWSMVKSSVKKDLSIKMEKILSFQQGELSVRVQAPSFGKYYAFIFNNSKLKELHPIN